MGEVTATVIDLFSGGGGMSCGFHRRPGFDVVAAVDAQIAKPSDRGNRLDCNATYRANIGIEPLAVDLLEIEPDALFEAVAERTGLERGGLTVLSACPPCTDFSRTKPGNHLSDSHKNSLVAKTADFVAAFQPKLLVMENAREMIRGRNGHHFQTLLERLRADGYSVWSAIEVLTDFGLPQKRERALVFASRIGPARSLSDLWQGYAPAPACTTVRHALKHVDPRDPMHRAPDFKSDVTRRRMEATPKDGGSWVDLIDHPDADELLIDSMKRRVARGDFGSHPDVYGRMAWDAPAPTIKRECSHVGNGRYAHPEANRLMTVREMALLNGFPADFQFPSKSLSKRYRHIGDAVPPLIAYQLSALAQWSLTGRRPKPADWVLEGTTLSVEDVVATGTSTRGRPRPSSPWTPRP